MPVIAGYDPNPSDNVRVEVAFTTAPDDPNPAWVDLTSRLDLASALMIARGRADEFSVVQPSSCSLTLDNHDGALTAANASSAFYPYVLPHRKIRVSYRDSSALGNFLDAEAASFEGGTTGGWSTTILGFTSPSISNSTTRAHGDGAHSLLIDWPATGSSGAGFFPTIVEGRQYTVTAWVFVPAGSPAVRLGSPFGTTPTDTSATTDAWEQLSVTFTADSNSTFLAIMRAGTVGAGQSAWVDEVRLDEGTDASVFTTSPPPIDYRFTGYVEEWPVEWPNGGAYSQVQITAVDRFSRIGGKMPMKSVIEQALLDDDPVIYFPLGEPEGATKAGEVAGLTGSAPASVVQTGAGGTIEFGTATGPPTDALPAPTFTPASATDGKFLEAAVPPNLGFGSLGFTSSTTLRASFLTSVSAFTNQTIAQLEDTYGSFVQIGLNGFGKVTATVLGAFSGGVYDIVIVSSSSFHDGGTHDAAFVLSQSGGTVTGTLYVDGVSVGTDSYSATFMPLFVKMRIGGTPSGRCFTGVISHVAAYASGLTAAQVGEHYTATSTGFEGDTSDERIARYARWAGIADDEMALDAGSSQSICFTDTTGLSVLQAMQDVAQTEGGRLFIDGAGVLTFHARSRMYDNPAASASVDAHLLGSDAQFSMSTQGLVNDLTGQRPTGPSVRALDADSIDTYGVFGQSLTLLVTSDTEVVDAINWRVQGNSIPQVRIPRGTFDLYTDSTGYQAQLRGLELGDRITITGLPSQAPASTVDLVLEGYTETIGLTGWTLAANLSNFSTVQALVLDDDVYGLLDGDNRLIY